MARSDCPRPFFWPPPGGRSAEHDRFTNSHFAHSGKPAEAAEVAEYEAGLEPAGDLHQQIYAPASRRTHAARYDRSSQALN
jgi:hypothetical protein